MLLVKQLTPETELDESHPVPNHAPAVLFRDKDLIALNKPSRMEVHKHTRGHRSREPYLLQWARELSGEFVYPIHRLDRGASGVVLFALNSEIAAAVQEQWMKTTTKAYLALVRGHFPDFERIDRALKRVNHKPGKQKTSTIDEPLKPSLTEVTCLTRSELPWPNKRYLTSRYSLVEAKPRTGRYHQIRRHLSFRGFPIIGDRVHGDGESNRLVESKVNQQRLYLHAWSLTFTHPVTQETITIKAHPGSKWERTLNCLNLAGIEF